MVPDRRDAIQAMQNGMGILSYLNLYGLRDRRDAIYLDTARAMGDYLVREALTPALGRYPRFTRSTGTRGQFPLAADAGSQGDHPYEIEPDKGGIAGYALVLLFEASGERKYLEQGLHNARVLAANQRPGDGSHSPWPFRADYRTAAGRGPVSGNMTYILRLYDALQVRGYTEFTAPRRALWRWIKHYQIPTAAADGALFAQFFEDHDVPSNRTAWAPLNLARYLLERRAALEPRWRTRRARRALRGYANSHSIVARSGAVSNGRRDGIRDMGGVPAGRAASWNHPQGGTVSGSSQTRLQALGRFRAFWHQTVERADHRA